METRGRFRSEPLAILLAACVALAAAPARADVTPPNTCHTEGAPCENAGPQYDQPGTCQSMQCGRALPNRDGGIDSIQYSCLLCAPNSDAQAGAGGESGANGAATGGSATAGGNGQGGSAHGGSADAGMSSAGTGNAGMSSAGTSNAGMSGAGTSNAGMSSAGTTSASAGKPGTMTPVTSHANDGGCSCRMSGANTERTLAGFMLLLGVGALRLSRRRR
jgi:MYXO-CTERM domain-containing protein